MQTWYTIALARRRNAATTRSGFTTRCEWGSHRQPPPLYPLSLPTEYLSCAACPVFVHFLPHLYTPRSDNHRPSAHREFYLGAGLNASWNGAFHNYTETDGGPTGGFWAGYINNSGCGNSRLPGTATSLFDSWPRSFPCPIGTTRGSRPPSSTAPCQGSRGLRTSRPLGSTRSSECRGPCTRTHRQWRTFGKGVLTLASLRSC